MGQWKSGRRDETSALYIFIYSLFNDAASVAQTVQRLMWGCRWTMNWKWPSELKREGNEASEKRFLKKWGCWRTKWRLLILWRTRFIKCHSLKGTKKNSKCKFFSGKGRLLNKKKSKNCADKFMWRNVRRCCGLDVCTMQVIRDRRRP